MLTATARCCLVAQNSDGPRPSSRTCAGKRDDHEARRRWVRVLALARDPVRLWQAADALVDLYLRRKERHQAIATLNDLRLRTRDRSLLAWIDQRLKEIAGD